MQAGQSPGRKGEPLADLTETAAALCDAALRDVGGHAYFFDFDGTLAEIAPRPQDVVLRPGLRADLARLHRASGGAVAVLSGRRRDELARYLPPGIPVAGLHGWDMDSPEAELARRARQLDPLREDWRRLASAHPGAVLEDKGQALALHWRLAPPAEPALMRAAEAAAQALGPDWALQPGKCVVEIRPNGGDKGDALRRFMARPPCLGRRPVAFGDDLTDIPMLRAARDAGGLAIAIGPRDLPCDLRLNAPADLALWLERSLDPA